MAQSEYQAAHRRAAASAICALGNRIGLYAGATRVGTVFADTTWGTAADITEAVDPTQPVDPVENPEVPKAIVPGSQVMISVAANTVDDGTIIDRYGVHNGSTLLRTAPLQIAMIINDGSQAFQVNVTPSFKYRGE
ncbi:hypothetical protein [Mycolicibacterium wolinskyi]|uniref:hypothetical protein n=1 Tax=Mycolicibacterium wolinskyi TaxID=59750 RepID=UPI003917A012